MNARELHDRYAAHGPIYADNGSDNHATILSALDLLARVEESDDELVLEINAALAPDWNMPGMVLFHRQLFERAAAALVALKAERDRLKAHADAMHHAISRVGISAIPAAIAEPFDAYRRDFPKDAP